MLCGNQFTKLSLSTPTWRCRFSPGIMWRVCSLDYRLLVGLKLVKLWFIRCILDLIGENDKYNYSKHAHLYPPFSVIHCSPKNYKIAPALAESLSSALTYVPGWFLKIMICPFLSVVYRPLLKIRPSLLGTSSPLALVTLNRAPARDYLVMRPYFSKMRPSLLFFFSFVLTTV